MSKLDHLVASARDGRAEWSADRADRVFAATTRRVERAKTIRRSAVAAGVVAVVAFVLLRAGSAPAASASDAPPELVAFDGTGDAGFARD